MPNKKSHRGTTSLELKSLSRLSSAIISDLSLEKVLDITVKELRRIFEIKICGIFLPDEMGIFRLIKYMGLPKKFELFFNKNINPQINKKILAMLRPLYNNDASEFHKNNKFTQNLVKIGGFNKEMSVPLKLKEEIIGILNVGRYAEEKDFTPHDLALVSIFANHVAIAINNAKLYKKLMDYTNTLEEQNKDLNTILKVGQAISRTLELDKILKAATEKMAKALNVGRCTVIIGTPTEGIGVIKGAYSKTKKEVFPLGTRLYLKNFSFLWKAIKQETHHYTPDICASTIPDFLKERYRKARVKSILFVPFVLGKQITGVFTISSLERIRAFSPREIKLAQTIANQVAMAIENARLMDIVKEHSHRLRALSTEVIRAHEEERKRIAEQLHDQLGQDLTTIKINLEMLSRSLPEKSKQTKERLLDTQHLLTETLEGIRYLTSDLRPTMLDDFGLVPTLRWYGESFFKRFGIKFTLRTNIPKRLPSEVEILIYRVTQEALTNVAKHSKAKEVWVNLSSSDSNASITIRDNGVGFDAKKLYDGNFAKNSFGLINMKERVQLLNGSFSVKSKAKSGTKLMVKIPVVRDEKNKSTHRR